MHSLQINTPISPGERKTTQLGQAADWAYTKTGQSVNTLQVLVPFSKAKINQIISKND